MIEKRRRAQRRGTGVSASGLIGWLIGASRSDRAPAAGRDGRGGSTGADGPVAGASSPAGRGSWVLLAGDIPLVARVFDPTSPSPPRRSAILCGARRSGDAPQETGSV